MYLLFAGDDYYPLPGVEDFVNSYGSMEEAKNALPRADWAQIAIWDGTGFVVTSDYHIGHGWQDVPE